MDMLAFVNLSGNNIKKIEGVDNLNKLRLLNLEKNNIKHIEGLYKLDSLDMNNLLIKDNPIEEIVRKDLQFLRRKGLTKDSWLENDIASGKIKVVEE